MFSILWRRLDVSGHDACRLLRTQEGGWRLEGAATYLHEGAPAALRYELECDPQWRSRRGLVAGWIGPRSIDVRIERDPRGGWTLDGRPVDGLDRCLDLDFGFTPATNLTQLRRLDLEIGQGTDVTVAWLDFDAGRLDTLAQRYERLSAEEYRYEAPRFGYSARLEVRPPGFVRRYPGLWEAVA
jgi:hypothetical protein